MEINFDIERISNPAVRGLANILKENETELALATAQLYYEFPIVKDLDDNIAVAELLLVSINHGLIAINCISDARDEEIIAALASTGETQESLVSLLFSRLIRNRILKSTPTQLVFPVRHLVCAPHANQQLSDRYFESKLVYSKPLFIEYIKSVRVEPLPENIFLEIIATLEGTKGILKRTPRKIEDESSQVKGHIANLIEAELATLDSRQKHGAISVLNGLQRIRGLAGSGKTVVLCMKVALTHLKNKDAVIVYTFYTKSLYQHVKRLITRFYRQYDDRDPDWSKLKILHAWGGSNVEGVYHKACRDNGLRSVSFTEAKQVSADPFGYVCSALLKNNLVKSYDFCFVDEGQDFANSFIKLCIALTKENRVVFAYDDMQTIFQATPPDLKEILGQDSAGELTEDVVLHKCYRNPREILLVAHALGFGVYGSVVQMLESKEQWEDIGYRHISGKFVTGNQVILERPPENSLPILSAHQNINEIVVVRKAKNVDDELDYLVDSIKVDLQQGLRPHDVLVISADDRHAKMYLNYLSRRLVGVGIKPNNIHEDQMGISDFHIENAITLSTVHKAKGNEAYMVYIVGIDALAAIKLGVRERNMLFTAMTRAKGWVRLSGVGEAVDLIDREIKMAIGNFPHLQFKYPSSAQLKIIKRDLQEKDRRKAEVERMLDEIREDLTDEEILRFIKQRRGKRL